MPHSKPDAKKIVIVSALRTPTGKLLGALSSLTATELGARVIRETLGQTGIKPSLVDGVILGNVLTAGVGQNPARQAALKGGLSKGVSALTVNMVCASGLEAVGLGAQAIQCGNADVIIAGGMESMSNAPYLVRDIRKGRKFGDVSIEDTLIHDGLWCSFYDEHMGTLCELTVKKCKLTRAEQDAFALQSHKRAARAATKGLFDAEIVPVRTKGGSIISKDETIRSDTNLRKLSKLGPAFQKRGTITAGNAPGLNDGAACVLLMTEDRAKRLGLPPLAEIIGHAAGHVDPKWYPLAPPVAVKKLLKKTGMKITDFDLIEENEAFAAQTLAAIKELGLDAKKVNVNGGAIALGHPIGASGARILVTLVHAMKQRNKKAGLATLCLGGGGGVSMAVKRT